MLGVSEVNPQNSHQNKPLSAVSQALKALFRREKEEPDCENVNPVDEIREGLKDIKAGRVREIKSARELLKDE